MSNTTRQVQPSVGDTGLIEKYRQQITNALQRSDWTLTNNSGPVDYDEKLEMGCYTLRVPRDGWAQEGGQRVASFELFPMISCCGICVSTKSQVTMEYRNRGIGTILNSLRIDIARYLRYGTLLCTDVVGNDFQQKILRANGWQNIHEFLNPRTGNRVAIHIINL